MNTQNIFDQLIKSGQSILQQKGTGRGDAMIGGLGRGALVASALGMLLGHRSPAGAGNKAMTYGGLAALGTLAYKAYENWRAQQPNDSQNSAQRFSSEPQTLDRVAAPQAEQHSQAILKAMVAAAKADGSIEENERQALQQELSKVAEGTDLQGWLQQEMNKPLDPAEVARAATTPEMAAEMYLASLMMVAGTDGFMQHSYLDELARQLNLAPGLKEELERQVQDQNPPTH